MVLLRVLANLSPRHGWSLVVAHFNHQLRGRASDADEKFVKRAALKLNCGFISDRANVRRLARQKGISLEMAGRECRHSFFVQAATQFGARTLVLAQHADDQVELFWLRLLRGAGGTGLAGMEWLAASAFDPDLSIARPFLGLTRNELAEFAYGSGVSYREDDSNCDLDILRNRLRHELIPLLKAKYLPAASKVILRAMEIIGEESAVVGAEAVKWLAHPGKMEFQALAVAIQRQCIQMQLNRLSVVPSFELIERLRQAPDIVIATGPNCGLSRDPYGRVRVVDTAVPKFDSAQVSFSIIEESGSMQFSGLDLAWKRTAKSGAKRQINQMPGLNQEEFDADKVGEEILLRHWRQGDRFQPIGLEHPVKLQDLLVNQKIPRGKRHVLVVAESALGGIFWVQGLRMAERFKLTAKTRIRLLWEWQPSPG